MLTARRMRRWYKLAVAVALIGVAGVVPAGPAAEALAQSGQDCWEMRRVIIGEDENGNPTYGWRLVNTCESGGGGGGSDGGANVCQHAQYGEFPCYYEEHGWWTSIGGGCYALPLSPPPPAGDSRWGDNDPSDGSLYTLACPQGEFGPETRFAESYVVLDDPPELPSVSELAQQAMESLPLAGADIGMAPGPDGAGLVGLPVWMWTDNTPATWGPVSVSVPGPGITVTAEGNATQIEWSMGDGTTVVCEGPGTPYEASYGDQHSPDCGHVYIEPSRSRTDGRYTIVATTTWHVEWWVEGGGATGEQFFSRTSETTVRINELQVVTS